MATQLGLMNSALTELGQALLVTTTDNVKWRHDIDAVYTAVLAECLQEANWKFATRTSEESSDGTPTVHDYNYYFTVPTDWVRTVALSGYSSFEPPLDRFEKEANRWYTSVDPLYVRYVSDDASYGGDLTAFPPSYERFVVLTLAARACEAVTGSTSRLQSLEERLRKAKANAKSIDAVEGPTRRFPAGSWVRARGAGVGTTRHDRQDP